MAGQIDRSRVGVSHACNISEIEEIMVNILSKLPASEVLKLEKVSKLWCQLIHEPQFHQLQFAHSPKNRKLLLQHCGDDVKDCNTLYLLDRNGKSSNYVTLSYGAPDFSLQMISPFNGLICCTRLIGSNDMDISICNPLTHKYLKLPMGSPSLTTRSVGVIYDPSRNKYKVVRFFKDALSPEDSGGSNGSDDSDDSDTEEINYSCEIYTPGDGSWGRIIGVMPQPVANLASPSFPTSVCVGGSLYWLVWSKEQLGVPNHILSIDMNGDLSRVELPGGFDDELIEMNLFAFLVEYRGTLAFVYVHDLEVSVEVWSLTDLGTSDWFLEGHIEMEINSFVVAVHSIVSIEDEILFVIEAHLVPYLSFHFLNLDTKTWREPKLPKIRIGAFELVVFPYYESLFRCDAAS